MENGFLRNKQILVVVMYKLLSNNITFKFDNYTLDVIGHFKLKFFDTKVEIVTNTYRKDFNFLNDVSDAFILEIVDRIIYKY